MKSIADPKYLEMMACLRALREAKGVSQQELATRLGREQSYVSKFEACERRLDLLETLAICQALDIRLEAIVPADLRHLLK